MQQYAQFKPETHWLLNQVFESLPHDKSNYLHGFLSKVVSEKCQPVLLHMLTIPEAMKQLRASCEKGLELHNPKILNTDKLQVSKGVEVAIGLFTHFKAQNQKEYDLAIHTQFSFVREILSLPTILKYSTLWPTLRVKEVFASFFFTWKELMATNKKELSLREQEPLLFVFANTMELACTLPNLDVQSLYPMLQVLRNLVKYLPISLLDANRSFVDEYYLTVILRN